MKVAFKYGTLLAFILLVAWGDNLYAQNKKWIYLYGSREAGYTKLYWDVFAWPADLDGFNLKRRIILDGQVGEWESLNIQTLSPDIETKEDWSNQGLNEAQAIDLDSTLAQYLRRGLVSESPNQDMIQVLKANNGLGSGDRIRMKTDFKLALMLDFACIDNNAIDGIEYEYGLFTVKSGTESILPQAVFSTRMLLPPDYKMVFQKLKQGIAVTWQLEREQQEGRSILGFYLYRRDTDSLNTAQLAETPLGSYKEVEELLVWRFNDLIANNQKSHEYGIAYVDVFQKMSDINWTLYDAEFFTDLEAPVIDTINLEDGQYVKLKWVLPESSTGKASAYVVELSGDAEPGKWAFANISDTLSGNRNEFIDTLYKQFGNVYFYRVGLVDKYGRTWYSRQKSIYYMGAIKPKKIASLEARIEIRESKAFVHLNWPLNKDTITLGYVLFSDELHEGVMNELAAIGRIKGPDYVHQIPTAGGREYTLGIAPLGKYGAMGEMESVKIYVPIAKMPPLYTFEAKLDDNLQAVLKWEYPEFKELKGFQILMNGKLIADTGALGPKVREFTVRKIQRKEESAYVDFTMKAIGDGMETPLSMKQSFYLPNTELNDIMPPDSLKVQLVRDSLAYYALLSWKKVNMDSLKYQGYILYADYYSEGSVQLMTSLPLITENKFLYRIPDMNRKSYTLRVAALTRDGKRGRYAQIKLSIDEQARKEAPIIEMKQAEDE